MYKIIKQPPPNRYAIGMQNIMFLVRGAIVVIMLLMLAPSAVARPQVGLVLSGGGASGVAHVGVLKVLEENNIPIDMIAGTSMGAIVGGLYASGMSIEELEETAQSLDWLSLFSDNQSRADQGFHQKRVNSGFFQNFELGIRDKKLQAPSGLIVGQKLLFELRKLFAPVSHIGDFDQLPIRFRAVATDIETGQSVVLGKGNLVQSIRASMSIPGLFAPVTINNQVLVDGFVSQNIPVDVARDMGADILIVVNIPTYLKKKEDLNSVIDVSLQAMDLMKLRVYQEQLSKITERDILIEPNIRNIGNLDFDRVHETIPLGEAAAKTQLGALKRLALAGYPKKNLTARQLNESSGQRVISQIRISNDSVLDDSVLAHKLGIREGDLYDPDKLQKGLENIHGLGYFALVDHRIHPGANGSVRLEINARKHDNGNQRLRFGMSLSDDLDGNTTYQVGARHTLLGVGSQGTEWRNSLIIGDTIRFDSNLYKPVPEHDAFMQANLWHEQRDFYFFAGDERLAEIRGRGLGLQLDVGKEFSTWGEARARLFYNYVEPDLKTGEVNDLFSQRIRSAGVEFQYNIDTTDKDQLPDTGKRLAISWRHGFEEMGADESFDRLSIRATRAWTRDRHGLIANAAIGTLFNDSTLLNEQFTLGGPGQLSGLAQNQLVGSHLLSGSLAYLYELSALTDSTQFFVGTSIEAGQVWQKRDNIDASDLVLGTSIFLGADTPLGPAFIGLAKTEEYELQPFLYFGQSF